MGPQVNHYVICFSLAITFSYNHQICQTNNSNSLYIAEGSHKVLGEEEKNGLYLLYKLSCKTFSILSFIFTNKVLWRQMMPVLPSPLKQIQVITQLSIVYTVICVCPRLLSGTLMGVWHSTTSEFPCIGQYLRAGSGWQTSKSCSMCMGHFTAHGPWRTLKLTTGQAAAGFMLEPQRPAALSWYTGRKDHLTGIPFTPL